MTDKTVSPYQSLHTSLQTHLAAAPRPRAGLRGHLDGKLSAIALSPLSAPGKAAVCKPEAAAAAADQVWSSGMEGDAKEADEEVPHCLCCTT